VLHQEAADAGGHVDDGAAGVVGEPAIEGVDARSEREVEGHVAVLGEHVAVAAAAQAQRRPPSAGGHAREHRAAGVAARRRGDRGRRRELGPRGLEQYLETKQISINLTDAPLGWY